MGRNIMATISIDDADPPNSTITVMADGDTLTEPTPITPEAMLGLAQAVSTATGDPDTEAKLRELLAPVAAAVQRSVDEGARRQAEREAALTAWGVVASTPDPPPA